MRDGAADRRRARFSPLVVSSATECEGKEKRVRERERGRLPCAAIKGRVSEEALCERGTGRFRLVT